MVDIWGRSALPSNVKNALGLSLGLLAWERDERRPPPQILSFLPPSLHSKPMTSGVSGGRDQPIGAELRTDRSLSPLCCSGPSATKEAAATSFPLTSREPWPAGIATAPARRWRGALARSEPAHPGAAGARCEVRGVEVLQCLGAEMWPSPYTQPLKQGVDFSLSAQLKWKGSSPLPFQMCYPS